MSIQSSRAERAQAGQTARDEPSVRPEPAEPGSAEARSAKAAGNYFLNHAIRVFHSAVYAVFTNEQFAGMARNRVRTAAALEKIDGVGPARVKKYGAAVLAVMTAEAGSAGGPTAERTALSKPAKPEPKIQTD